MQQLYKSFQFRIHYHFYQDATLRMRGIQVKEGTLNLQGQRRVWVSGEKGGMERRGKARKKCDY